MINQVQDLPINSKGPWSVEKFNVNAHGAMLFNLRCRIQEGRFTREREIVPGDYTRLVHKERGVVMSDTPAEIQDLREAYIAVDKAVRQSSSVSVLTHGLGLGMFPSYCLQLKAVAHVTIVEIDPDVIELTGAYYLKKYGAERLTIIEADAYTWKPPKNSKWDIVWHDIFDTICTDNWDSIKRLHRRFGGRSKWQGTWARPEVQRMREMQGISF